MGKHKDAKIARKYGIPVESIREGLPKVLHGVPDHQIRSGNLIRVSTTSGLEGALSQVPPQGPSIRVYIVPYMAPVEADTIRDFLGLDWAEPTKADKEEAAFIAEKLGICISESECRAPRAVIPGGRDVVIANPLVLSSKKLAPMAIRGEQEVISFMKNQLLSNPSLYPHELIQLPTTEERLGLSAIKDLPRLKEVYLASKISSGTHVALSILKQSNKTLYKSLFKPKGPPLSKEEKDEMIIKIASEYMVKHNLKGDGLDPKKIASQMLGVISLADWEDRKKLIVHDTSLIGERKYVLKKLKREIKKFNKLETKESLIGSALANFKEL